MAISYTNFYMLTLEDLRKQVPNAQLLGESGLVPIAYLLTDTRKLLGGEGALFIALAGPRHDGHDYIEAAYEKGVRQFIIGRTPKKIHADAIYLLVDSPIAALQTLAKMHRAQFDLPVIAITGSNGKTIVKEWLSKLLSTEKVVAKNPKSYNSQIGVPLSIWEIKPKYEIGIFEAGISQVDEMSKLADIIQPTIGIFTNLGSAHDEGFQSRLQKLEEKLKLFIHCKSIIACADQPLVYEELTQKFDQSQLVLWSSKKGQAYQIDYEKTGKRTIIHVQAANEYFQFACSFTDHASLENITHAIVTALHVGISASHISQELLQLAPLSMRLSLKSGQKNNLLIDDTYNNDLAGLQIALNFLNQQSAHKSKTLILSDLLEAGMNPSELYQQVAEMIKASGVSKLFLVGQQITTYQHYFDEIPTQTFEHTEGILASGSLDTLQNEIILVKGARVFTFEKIIAYLQEKVHGTSLEINLNHLVHNLNFYKSKLKPSTKTMVMVKAHAYGSGSEQVANLLQNQRVDYLAVAYADEGIALRKAGIHLPIMVLNVDEATFDLLVKWELEPVIYSLKIFKSLAAHLKDSPLGIHLDLDTGMHRLGFEPAHLEELITLIHAYQHLNIKSIYTHLAGADEANLNDYSKEQLDLFEWMSRRILVELPYRPLLHALNSAGILRFPDKQYDMVRLGIGLYGLEVNGMAQQELLSISTLKTTISQIKYLKKGQSVGYSRKGMLHRDSVIATIAIGYADGFDRGFSNGKALVSLNGHLVPTVGNVCMDMTMIDITGISAKEGDEVIIFGPQNSLKALADAIDTIPYEILTGISERVKRIYFEE